MALAVAMMLHVRWFLSLGEDAVERGSVDGDPGAGRDGVGGRCAARMLHVRWFLSLGEAAVERGSVDGDPGAGSDGVGGGDAVDARRACSIFIVFHL